MNTGDMDMEVADFSIRSVQNHVNEANNSYTTEENIPNENFKANSEWRDLANIMDRFFLLIYSLTTLIVTLVFMLQCAARDI